MNFRFAFRCSALHGWVDLRCGICDLRWAVLGKLEDAGQCPACGEPFLLGLLRQRNTDRRLGQMAGEKVI